MEWCKDSQVHRTSVTVLSLGNCPMKMEFSYPTLKKGGFLIQLLRKVDFSSHTQSMANLLHLHLSIDQDTWLFWIVLMTCWMLDGVIEECMPKEQCVRHAIVNIWLSNQQHFDVSTSIISWTNEMIASQKRWPSKSPIPGKSIPPLNNPRSVMCQLNKINLTLKSNHDIRCICTKHTGS